MIDVAIVGAGPAGLSAALVLGRCRRSVVVFDSGEPRNGASRAAHGLLSRDGIEPHSLLAKGREEIARYGVRLVPREVAAIRPLPLGFRVEPAGDGGVVVAKKLLLATGMRDTLPAIARARLGRGVYVCPYCDGWEHRDRPLGVWATSANVRQKALGMLTWSAEVTALTDGEPVDPDDERALAASGVRVVTDRIARLDGDGEHLAAVVLEDGTAIACEALFVHTGQEQAAPFAVELGCSLAPNGTVNVGAGERTGVPGLWVAGDASHDLQLVAVALAEGVKAACAINTELREEALGG